MPRYFFHYHEGRAWTADDMGVEFPDVETAYLAAYEAALDMWAELLRARRDPRACYFEINDENGKTMFTLPFSEVLESCHEQAPGEIATCAFKAVLSARARLRHCMLDFRKELRTTHEALAEARSLIRAATKLVRSLDVMEGAPLPPPRDGG